MVSPSSIYIIGILATKIKMIQNGVFIESPWEVVELPCLVLKKLRLRLVHPSNMTTVPWGGFFWKILRIGLNKAFASTFDLKCVARGTSMTPSRSLRGFQISEILLNDISEDYSDIWHIRTTLTCLQKGFVWSLSNLELTASCHCQGFTVSIDHT